MQVFSFFINFFRRIGTYFSICLFIATGSSYGFIYQLDEWNKGCQKVYCLSSVDISTNYSKRQLNDLAQCFEAQDTRIIVEDICDYEGKDDRIKKYLNHVYYAANQKKFLLGSVDYLQSRGIPKEKIDNVEYRHAAYTAIDGDISLSANDVMEPAYNEYHKGWKYRDEEIFERYYKNKLQDYRKLVLKPCRSLFFYMYWRSSKPLTHVLSNASYYKSLDSVVSLFDGDVHQDTHTKLMYIIKNHGDPLIGIRLARAIAQAAEKNIVVCAQADRIKEINTLLRSAGCKHVRSESGSVRVGPRNSGAPRALKLQSMLEKNRLPTKKRAAERLLKQVDSDSNVLIVKSARENSSSNTKVIILLLLLLSLILVVKRWYYVRHKIFSKQDQ